MKNTIKESKDWKIDIIVPCYHAKATLPRLLGSIMCQTIVNDIDVTLAIDGDNEDYTDIVEKFSEFLSIKQVVSENNGGPGFARQLGYSNTTNPLVTWIDADDTFAGAFALEVLRNQMLAEPENVICIGTFAEERDDVDQFMTHPQDTIWMFGKMYKRSFLDKYEITLDGMPHVRANEDNGMNMLCKFMSNQNEKIKFIGDIVYYWHTNVNSITRINNCQYSYDQSFVGYTENMIWALKEGERRNPFNPAILFEKVAIMINLYEYYIEVVARDKRFIDQNWESCKLYYKEIYDEIKHKIPDMAFRQAYNDVMRNAYMGNKLFDIIPCMGIQEFLDKLDAEIHGEYSKGSTKISLESPEDSNSFQRIVDSETEVPLESLQVKNATLSTQTVPAEAGSIKVSTQTTPVTDGVKPTV